MRSVLLGSLLASLIAAAPAAAARRPYANFKVTVTGTQTTVVNGREECDDAVGTVVPATAHEDVSFATPKGRVLQFFAPGGGSITVDTPRGGGQTTVVGRGSMTRQSEFVPGGDTPPGCSGGQPQAGCGATTFAHISFLVQGGVNEVALSASGLRPKPGLCVVPTLAFPDMVGTTDYPDTHVTYKARVRAGSLLDTRKRVVVIHGKGTATRKAQDGATIVDSATTTLKFTMRLRRVPLH